MNKEAHDMGKLTFEKAMEELNEISDKLSKGNMPLDEMVALYERGVALSKRCMELLNAFDARIEIIEQSRSTKEDNDGII